MGDPLYTELNNPGRDDWWSCPACLAGLPSRDGFRKGDASCPECECKLELTVAYEPVCRARLKEVSHD